MLIFPGKTISQRCDRLFVSSGGSVKTTIKTNARFRRTERKRVRRRRQKVVRDGKEHLMMFVMMFVSEGQIKNADWTL
jgi:hypothetical protein